MLERRTRLGTSTTKLPFCQAVVVSEGAAAAVVMPTRSADAADAQIRSRRQEPDMFILLKCATCTHVPMNRESVESESALDAPSTTVALPQCAGERNSFLLGSPDRLAAPGPRSPRRRSTTARSWGSTPNLHKKLFDRDRFHDLAYMKRRLAPPPHRVQPRADAPPTGRAAGAGRQCCAGPRRCRRGPGPAASATAITLIFASAAWSSSRTSP